MIIPILFLFPIVPYAWTISDPFGRISVSSKFGHSFPGYRHGTDSWSVYGFYGIRYGVADRFENSRENTDFSYFRDQTSPWIGFSCPQKIILLPGTQAPETITESEDCLFLDVYVPEKALTGEPLPVMFWIHGGGFEIGGKVVFNGTLIAKDAEVLVVSPNYRLNILGFLSTGDEASPGNYGVADLKLAFQWVLKNIAAFGGDPGRIFISGQSAGGALTSLLLLDDEIRQNTVGSVLWSGSSLGQWTYQLNPKSLTKDYGRSLGCPTGRMKELLDCLRDIPLHQLMQPQYTDNLMKLFRHAPAIDGVHLNGTALEEVTRFASIENNKDFTFVTGFLKEDSSFLHTIMDPELFEEEIPFSLIASLVRKYLPAGKNCPKKADAELWRKVMARYGLEISLSSKELRENFFKFTSDALFAYPAIKEAWEYRRRTNQQTIVFIIEYTPGFKDFGAFHTMDFAFLFRGPWEVLMPKELWNDKVSESLRHLLRQVGHRLPISTSPLDGLDCITLNQDADWVPGCHLSQWKSLTEYLSFWDEVFSFNC